MLALLLVVSKFKISSYQIQGTGQSQLGSLIQAQIEKLKAQNKGTGEDDAQIHRSQLDAERITALSSSKSSSKVTANLPIGLNPSVASIMQKNYSDDSGSNDSDSSSDSDSDSESSSHRKRKRKHKKEKKHSSSKKHKKDDDKKHNKKHSKKRKKKHSSDRDRDRERDRSKHVDKDRSSSSSCEEGELR